ncbi:Trp biosynthesis-associated membrane protein [Spirilliplanes yamanashiensis]|uniref:Tryptophan-associated transmembrane protein n=1 Tax=Spirilliplanes yamanashiensis TaxID=42233 RepID=A0A8J4DJ23_9ACTN|nr:Trp biosynthesis-associated membrane protein [Spirilliplanes yamanashiensis]MDP9817017.1 hypothetical protein [Spirilliplanes yamanashiensis]GIJ03326.1 hypothetical protein Sya03_26780 [Spirilliplanes yamanashiensis]
MPAAPADRRGLARAVLACLAGAGLALFAATRVWAVERTGRSGGLPALEAARTGGDLLAWLPAVALAGLAGAGALLALKGVARRAAGVLIVAAGALTAAGGVAGLGRADDVWWPALTVLGGLAAAAGGALAVARGHRWSAMGARYERPAGTRAGGPTADQARADPARDAWDALDRGEDPTTGSAEPTTPTTGPAGPTGPTGPAGT